MEEQVAGCPAIGSLLERIVCILTYHGSIHDIVINYVMLVINFAWCQAVLSFVLSTRHQKKGTTTTTTTTTNQELTTASSKQQSHTLYAAAIASFAFVWMFQIVLCLVLAVLSEDGIGCAGISIVWCAMAGWIWYNKKHSNMNKKKGRQHQDWFLLASGSWLERMATVLNLSVIFYYFLVEELITTIAHICALVLGALLSKMSP
jgi:hypothetical protein